MEKLLIALKNAIQTIEMTNEHYQQLLEAIGYPPKPSTELNDIIQAYKDIVNEAERAKP